MLIRIGAAGAIALDDVALDVDKILPADNGVVDAEPPCIVE